MLQRSALDAADVKMAVGAGVMLVTRGLAALVGGVAPQPPRLAQARDRAVDRGLAHILPGQLQRLVRFLRRQALLRARGEERANRFLLPRLIGAAL